MSQQTLRFYLFTFRPQVSEFPLFETFLTILKPQLHDNKTLKQYAWSVENDTPTSISKHIHILMGFEKTKSKNNPVTQFFNAKVFKDFKNMLKNKQTNEPVGFDDRIVADTEEDFLKVLGYVLKETQVIRKCSTFPLERVSQAIDYYYQCDHIDKAQPKKQGWTLVTTKNIHVLMEKYVEDNDLDWSEFMIHSKIIEMMKKDHYTFVQITMKQLKIVCNELYHAHTEDHKELIKEDCDPYMYEKVSDQSNYIMKLQQKLKDHNIPI